MPTENNQSNSIIPETPGKSPALYYTANQYARHAALVKQTNEWLLDKYRRQLRNTHHILRDKEQLLAKKEQALVEKEIQLCLAKQELVQLKNFSILQFALGILSALISGYGINLITTTPPVEAGWMLVSIAIILQYISFFTTYQARKKGNM
jgi:hypothetical protein